MVDPANLKKDPLRHFAAWLMALFVIVLGAKLWVVQLFGSPLPLWDQWYEARSFFVPFVEGHLTVADFFVPANEHRILFTRLLDLGVIWLNGRWEPLLQMTINAFIHATFVCALAFGLWDFLGRKDGWLVCFLLAPFFALPFAGENTIWAINSLQYLMGLFSLATLAGLGFGKPGSWFWWFGLAAAIMVLFTTASGLLAPMAVGGLAVLRAIKQRRLDRQNLITLATCLAVVGLGVALMVTVPEDRPLQAHTVREFLSALARNLAWPFIKTPAMMCLVPLPLVWLLALYFRPNFKLARAAEFLFALALWSGLQSAALAYGRANYGEGIPASRYMDSLAIFVIASLFATLLLRQLWPPGRLSKWAAPLLPFVVAGVVVFSLVQVSTIVVAQLLLPTRMMNLAAEERVETFLTTREPRDLFETPTVRPDPKLVLELLCNTNLQTILPAVCLPPTDHPVTGRFTAASQWLLKNSTAILACGLGLFAGLCGFGLVRQTLGLAGADLAGTVVLLVTLTAMGFVWSKSPIQRPVVERELHYQLAAYFNSVNNPRRAAIHEQKAEALKNQ